MGQATEACRSVGESFTPFYELCDSLALTLHQTSDLSVLPKPCCLRQTSRDSARGGGWGIGAIMLSSHSEHVQGLAGLPWGTTGEMISQPPRGGSAVDTSLLGSRENVRPRGLPGKAAHKPEELKGTGPRAHARCALPAHG